MIDYVEQVDDYVNGRLSEELKRKFEVELSQNPELQLAVKDHDIVLGIMDFLWEEDIREVVEQVCVIKPVSRLPIHRYMRLAASLLLLVGATTLLMKGYVFKISNHSTVLKQYYIPPTSESTVRSEQLDQDSQATLQLAEYYFDLRDFAKCKQVILEIMKKTQNVSIKEKANFYLGNILYIQNDLAGAISALDNTEDPRKVSVMAQIYFIQGNTKALEDLCKLYDEDTTCLLYQKSQLALYSFFK